MKKLSLITKDARIAQDCIEQVARQLAPEIDRVDAVQGTDYTSDYSSVNVPFDQERYDHIHGIIKEKQALQPDLLVVIGIGGSNLGTMAVQQALHGQLYNELNPKLKVYFVDSVDDEYVHTVLGIVKLALHNQQKIILNVVTKSGTTTETVANFLIFLDLLKKFNSFEYKKHVVVTTDYKSPLWHIAHNEGFACLEIPQKVGGRFSVLTAVGIFPLGMLGINTAALLHGARDMVIQSSATECADNPAALSAIIKYLYYQQGVRINDLFVFGQSLAGIGRWYRQLVGESLGKTITRDGKKVEIGITPTASVGTTDLHSVGQLYLGGPRDRLVTFARAVQPNHAVRVPELSEYDKLVPSIQGKKLSAIMTAIYEGTVAAYGQEKRPFMQLIIPQCSAYYVGQVMQMYMIEVMYLGFLLEVNPFDQPQVELYKVQTRKILAHE